MNKTKVCKHCLKEKDINDFSLETSSKNGRKYRRLVCIECRKTTMRIFYQNSPERKLYRQRKAILAAYSLTFDDYENLLKKQKGKCAICKQECVTGKMLAVDHDHSCCPPETATRTKKSCGKCVRGLLCSRCNTGIGYFQNSIQFLFNAIKYLRTADAKSKKS